MDFKTLILKDNDFDEVVYVCHVTLDVDGEEFERIFNKIRHERMESEDYGGDQEVLKEMKKRFGNKFLGESNYEILDVS